MKIGYVRVSRQEQDLVLRLDALTKEGCEQIFQEKVAELQRKSDTLGRMSTTLAIRARLLALSQDVYGLMEASNCSEIEVENLSR